MVDNIIFNSGDKKLIIEPLYTVEDYLTFNIKIKSGEFSGTSSFCISKEKIIEFIDSLSEMIDKLTGCCELKDYDSDAYIVFEALHLGHISVHGQIGGSHQDHNIKLKYIIDQTALNNIIKILEKSLSSA